MKYFQFECTCTCTVLNDLVGINFVSNLYTGCMSDAEITFSIKLCGIMNLLESG